MKRPARGGGPPCFDGPYRWREGGAGGHLWPRPSSAPSSEPDGSCWLPFHPSPRRGAEHDRSARFQHGDRADFGFFCFLLEGTEQISACARVGGLDNIGQDLLSM